MSVTQPIENTPSNKIQKAQLIGQKPPLKPREVWSIRVRLQISGKKRDLALFNLAIDSKLRSCDLVTLRVADVSQGGRVRDRAVVVQQKTHRPVQFELTEQTREAVRGWIYNKELREDDFLFPSRVHDSPHRQPLGGKHWSRPEQIWHSLASPY